MSISDSPVFNAPVAPGTTSIHLLRHGEVFNPDHVLYGRLPNFHLSELGRQMAVGIADYFEQEREKGHPAGTRLVEIYASPMERAQETAAPLAQRFNLPVITDERLIESGNKFEGLSHVASRLRDPRYWPAMVNPFRPSWGEPYADQVKRMISGIHSARNSIESQHGVGAQAVLVSHQLPIWVTRLSALKRPLWHNPRQRQCSLTSITSFDFLNGKLSAVRYHEPNARLLAQATNLPGA